MRTVAAAAAALFAARAIAHPVASNEARSSNIERRLVDLDKFRLKTEATYVDTEAVPAEFTRLVKRESYVDTATDLVKSVVPGATFRLVGDHYVGANGIAHVNFKQTAHGLDIDNADFNVNIAKDGTVFSYGNSFFKGDVPEASPLTKRDFVDPVAAVSEVSKTLSLGVVAEGAKAKPEDAPESYVIEGTKGAFQPPKAKLVYFVKPDDTIALTWRVETDLEEDWLLSYVDAATSKTVEGVVNYKSDASYEVFPWGVNDPEGGSRKILVDPYDANASPYTWEGTASQKYDTTRGNNGIAQANYEGDSQYLNDYRPTSLNKTFVYPLDLTKTDPKANVNASVTQLWYSANMFHDVFYDLGFTEAAGNFQTDVGTKGGVGNDAVILHAQDGSGTNNANFLTPPDGQAGRMRMYIWTQTTPVRDCSFESGVVIHEYAHGLSNRLTGGPANSACLNVLEAGGMGEGWGDFLATAIRTTTKDSRKTDFPMGAWVFGKPQGIRTYLYSTSMTTNPLTYLSVNNLTRVHAIGNYWGNVLYEVMWELIEEHGNTDEIKPKFKDGVPQDGKFLTMKLVVDGMALQPCNPTIPQARDAIIDADKNLTGGKNKCLLWRAFAKRGLGPKAQRNTGTSRTEDFSLPAECEASDN
jgi:extracellular elastinolytic metalloproteinase